MYMFWRNTLHFGWLFLFLMGLVWFIDRKEQFDHLFGIFFSLGLFSHESALFIREREIDRYSPVFSASYMTPFLWRIQKDLLICCNHTVEWASSLFYSVGITRGWWVITFSSACAHSCLHLCTYRTQRRSFMRTFWLMKMFPRRQTFSWVYVRRVTHVLFGLAGFTEEDARQICLTGHKHEELEGKAAFPFDHLALCWPLWFRFSIIRRLSHVFPPAWPTRSHKPMFSLGP